MKRVALTLLSLFAVSALFFSPGAALAAPGGTVVASVVIVPAQVSDLGFLSTALVRDISVEEGDVVATGQILAVLDTPEQEYLVKAADAAYRSAAAYAELQRYRDVKTKDFRGRTIFLYMPREVVLRADSLADAAHASLEVAQASMELSTLTAPYDGTITKVHILPGQLAQLGQPVLTLATLDQMQVETTDLSERDIANVKVGQKASVFVEALNAEFPATVIAIAPRADNLGGDVVFKVTLSFDIQPAGLLWGMTGEVTIVTE